MIDANDKHQSDLSVWRVSGHGPEGWTRATVVLWICFFCKENVHLLLPICRHALKIHLDPPLRWEGAFFVNGCWFFFFNMKRVDIGIICINDCWRCFIALRIKTFVFPKCVICHKCHLRLNLINNCRLTCLCTVCFGSFPRKRMYKVRYWEKLFLQLSPNLSLNLLLIKINDNFSNLVIVALECPNTLAKKHMFELLTAVCVYSHLGHYRLLDALDHFTYDSWFQHFYDLFFKWYNNRKPGRPLITFVLVFAQKLTDGSYFTVEYSNI